MNRLRSLLVTAVVWTMTPAASEAAFLAPGDSDNNFALTNGLNLSATILGDTGYSTQTVTIGTNTYVVGYRQIVVDEGSFNPLGGATYITQVQLLPGTSTAARVNNITFQDFTLAQPTIEVGTYTPSSTNGGTDLFLVNATHTFKYDPDPSAAYRSPGGGADWSNDATVVNFSFGTGMRVGSPSGNNTDTSVYLVIRTSNDDFTTAPSGLRLVNTTVGSQTLTFAAFQPAPAPQGVWLMLSAVPLALGAYFMRRRLGLTPAATAV